MPDPHLPASDQPSADPVSPAPMAQASAHAPAPRALRNALGRYATGVTIVACVDAAGHRVGLTVNSFAALSLEPALVLWSLRRASPSAAVFDAATHFSVNVLAESQLAVSQRFAAHVGDKFALGDWSAGLGGAPVLAGCAAVFECRREARHETGDHLLYIGRVLRLADQDLAPLLFQGGQYRRLGGLL